MRSGNLFEHIAPTLGEETVTVLASGRQVRVERIVSRGQASPPGFWYDQDEAEYVLLVAGSAVLELEGSQPRTLHPGDWVDIPAHLRHRVVWTDPTQETIWLATFYR
jgi:cupin 2 domain-containing protein